MKFLLMLLVTTLSWAQEVRLIGDMTDRSGQITAQGACELRIRPNSSGSFQGEVTWPGALFGTARHRFTSLDNLSTQLTDCINFETKHCVTINKGRSRRGPPYTRFMVGRDAIIDVWGPGTYVPQFDCINLR